MPPRARFAALAALGLLALTHDGRADDASASPSPIGFAPASRAAEAAAEAKAVAVPTPESARRWLRTLTAEPHAAGTPADYRTAVFVRDKLREWGWEADLAEYEVLLNYPSQPPTLTLNPPGGGVKPLPTGEAPHAADKDSANPLAFGAFHGYGVSGGAHGQVVYANYGRPDDFAALERVGVAVKDKIVLVRYGEIFRGLKVRNAQQRGAAGILIYSDPADDGFAKGDVYPNGPYRPATAVQRGSVQFLSLGPGDPSTPNGPSTKGAARLPIDPMNGFPTDMRQTGPGGGPMGGMGGGVGGRRGMMANGEPGEDPVKAWEKATGLVRNDYYANIPSLPISYEAARPILESLAGPNVPGGWQGGLPLTYHVGPGAAEVSFAVWMDYKVRTIWNVVAKLKGSAEPDRWVMIGNHRDAWVYGAVDPGSGTASTLETCRALGAAVKAGWKPRRTLVYASWDAEEYGLVGSTEWADEHAKEVDEKAVLMLNVDSAVGGHELDMDGVPSLRDFLLEATGAVTDVRSGRTLRQLWTDKKRAAWAANAPVDFADPLWDANGGDSASASAPAAPKPSAKFSPQLNALGSGSDYTAFLDHLGVPAIDAGFGGRYGVYHSVYDDFFWMEKFCDPEFLTHATAARLYTVIAMRAAGAEVAPFKFVPYGEALREYVDDLRRTVERKARGAVAGQGKPPVTFDGLASVVKSVRAFQAQAAAVDRATDALAARDGVDDGRLARVNDALKNVERAFLLPDGLPGRPWFKHAVYAPGLTTGYASWPLPGVRQAILDNDAAMLAAQTPALVARIDAATVALKAAADEAQAAAPKEARRSEPANASGARGAGR